MEPARGFIALISAIIISAVLIGVAATLDQGVFFTRFDALNGEYKRISSTLADSCIEVGLERLADNYGYLVPSDPAYDALQHGVPVAIGTLYGKEARCLLMAPTTTPSEVNHRRAFIVVGKSSFNGAFSERQATVTVINPAYGTGSAAPYLVPANQHEIP